MKVLITGGELFNKGAQAMTFAVVNAVKQHYPEASVYLLSAMDARRPREEQDNLQFSILPWDLRMKLRCFPGGKWVFKNKYFSDAEEKQMWTQVQTADLVVDVSGFCLSSQFSNIKIIDYLMNIHLFKGFNVPIVLFPQSFGPFEFKGPLAPLLKRAIKTYLRYPKQIFARETEGQNLLSQLSIIDNVQQSLDTVIRLPKPAPEMIWKQPILFDVPTIQKGAVGIIPNQKIIVKNTSNDLYGLYEQMIERLLAHDRIVYLLRHSFEDLAIIIEIKQRFEGNERVVVLGEDYHSPQLVDVIAQFDFVIASRYHALVHAFKCYVPAVVLGWAVKYQELMARFGQLDCCFDVRGEIEQGQIANAIDEMSGSHEQQSKIIAKTMSQMTDGQLFGEALKHLD